MALHSDHEDNELLQMQLLEFQHQMNEVESEGNLTNVTKQDEMDMDMEVEEEDDQ